MEHGAVFELSGGALCLDFANTWGDRERPEEDKLRVYPDLLAFARQTGTLTAGEAARLVGRAGREPREAAAAVARALKLRETLYRIFSAGAAGRGPEAADLERLNAAMPETLSHLRLESRGAELVWAWAAEDDPLEAPLWPVVRSAAELLTSEERQWVRECGGSACNWLFLDHSRNRSRRWCSMETCGNRAKAQRHYRRRTDQDSAGSGDRHG
jgi:predicted RNA-binding Zn ribbon-like protein